MSGDYHAYVISDGRLVGAWDEMYAACEDPWHQSEDVGSGGRQAVIRFARQISARSLLEVGCGLGFFTAEFERQGFHAVGMDASSVAIARARNLHPQLADRFEVGRAERDLGRQIGVDAVIFAEVTWYVLDHLDAVLDGLRRHHSGAYLIHLLTFYAEGRQQYGREFFTAPEQLIERFAFEPIAETRTSARTGGDYASTILFQVS